MLLPIMDLFLKSSTNLHDAQIVFTCHAVEILNLLQKSQVMLVEKDEQGLAPRFHEGCTQRRQPLREIHGRRLRCGAAGLSCD